MNMNRYGRKCHSRNFTEGQLSRLRMDLQPIPKRVETHRHEAKVTCRASPPHEGTAIRKGIST